MACNFTVPTISPWTNFLLLISRNQSKFKFAFILVAGIFAVLGHNYTCWLKIQRRLKVSQLRRAFISHSRRSCIEHCALAVFILTILVTRYVSVGSIAAAIALPVTIWIMSPDNLFLCIVTTALGALAIYKHKSNIQRLMAGTESRLGKKSGTGFSLSDRQDACPTKNSEDAK